LAGKEKEEINTSNLILVIFTNQAFFLIFLMDSTIKILLSIVILFLSVLLVDFLEEKSENKP